MGKIYGYCRISTKKQSIKRQIRNIKEAYPAAIIVAEEYTGTTLDRKKWNKLYLQVHNGDTIVFDSVSRMSRNAAEGFEAYEELYYRGVSLVFLKEPHINTDTFKKALSDADLKKTGTNVDFILEGVSKYLMSLAKEQIKIAFAQSEKEVQDLHRRTSEGIETARLHGKQIGQRKGAKLTTKKSIAAKEIIKKHNKSFHGTLSNEDTWKLAGISKMTFYKYRRELLTELPEGEKEM
nr:recombinase family protein [uncultured Anaerotignum sp.]